jgi:biotin synthase-like enzyme
MRVTEGILIDRMRYKPQRVDDKLLAKLAKKLRKEYKKARLKDIQNEKILSHGEMDLPTNCKLILKE